jgi:putative sporulation protein YyaC
LAGALLKSQSKPIFLCVGSDKVVGDSIGAIIGELLSKKYKINAHIYGDLDNNADANNIQEIVQEIKEKYPTSPVILIDGILGELGDVGQVKFYENGAYASGQFGKGVFVGDYSILAVVGVKGIDSLQFLSSVKLKTIVNQAEFIADSINRAFKYTQNLLNVF